MFKEYFKTEDRDSLCHHSQRIAFQEKFGYFLFAVYLLPRMGFKKDVGRVKPKSKPMGNISKSVSVSNKSPNAGTAKSQASDRASIVAAEEMENLAKHSPPLDVTSSIVCLVKDLTDDLWNGYKDLQLKYDDLRLEFEDYQSKQIETDHSVGELRSQISYNAEQIERNAQLVADRFSDLTQWLQAKLHPTNNTNSAIHAVEEAGERVAERPKKKLMKVARKSVLGYAAARTTIATSIATATSKKRKNHTPGKHVTFSSATNNQEFALEEISKDPPQSPVLRSDSDASGDSFMDEKSDESD